MLKSVLALMGATLLTAVVAIGLSNSLSQSRVSERCGSVKRSSYLLVIKSDQFHPNLLVAKYCDTLTVKNLDPRGRLLAFGRHDYHESYDGVVERFLAKDEQFTFTLDKTGSFLIHDHNQATVQAEFTVLP